MTFDPDLIPPLRPAADPAEPFPRTLTDALFAAVLVDDEIDPDLRLPDHVELDHSAARLSACFQLCRHLWLRGFDRDALARIAGTAMVRGDLTAMDRLALKHIRAKFKHFRYAHALYGATGAPPFLLRAVTTAMGQLQDACRHDRRSTARLVASGLRLLLTGPAVHRLRIEGDRLVPTSPGMFRTLLLNDAATLDQFIAAPTVTGHSLHAARKRIGRQVSFWDTLRTLESSEDRVRMSRWLSAINGLMGRLHDDLLDRRADARGAYDAAFVLPGDIRDRIAMLNQRIRLNRAPEPPPALRTASVQRARD